MRKREATDSEAGVIAVCAWVIVGIVNETDVSLTRVNRVLRAAQRMRAEKEGKANA